MIRGRRFWIALVAVVLMGATVFVYLNYIRSSREQASEPALQTATVRRGDLVIMASASGQLVAAAELSIGFKGGGEIVEILVELGDQVEIGEVLARVDETSALSKLAQAEQSLRELTSPSAVATA
jgi:HlyD family secretion protein